VPESLTCIHEYNCGISAQEEPMNPGRNRWKLRIAVVLLAAGAMLIWALRQQQQPTSALTIVNQSGQKISVLKITIAGHSTTVKDIPTGEELVPPAAVQSGDPFSLEVTLVDGSSISRINGTAADGLRIIVEPGGSLTPKRADKS
jgi:hypothetical protein